MDTGLRLTPFGEQLFSVVIFRSIDKESRDVNLVPIPPATRSTPWPHRPRRKYRVDPVTLDLPGTLLLDPGEIENPYPFYRRLQMQAPVWRVPDRDVFTVSSFELLVDAVTSCRRFLVEHACALLYRDEEGLPSRLSFGEAGVDALATADPPDHKMHRNVVFSELVAKRMATLEPDIAGAAAHCVGRALDAENVDFMAEVGNVVPITLISRLIGFPDSNPEMLLSRCVRFHVDVRAQPCPFRSRRVGGPDR